VPDAQLVLKHMGLATLDLPELPYPERVTVIGNVPYEAMVDYYRAADVCVSMTSSDGSPRSIWEAMACGTPCVVSDLPWVRELIEPGNEALAVDIDPGALADAVLQVFAQPDLAARLGEGGRRLVIRDLDRERHLDSLVDVYHQLVDHQI
jgi:glycosyltransferase involved in cell wall biosynthesis